MKASNGGDAVFVKPNRECIRQLLIKAEFWDAGTSSGQWCSQKDQDGVAGRMQSVAMVLSEIHNVHMGIHHIVLMERVLFLSCFCFVLLVLES